MLILKSSLLHKYPQIIFGFSTKVGLKREAPYYFNMSLSVGDNRQRVLTNRKLFFKRLGLSNSSVVVQKQVHSDNIAVVNVGSFCGESDAMITNKPGLGLSISTADCPAIFLFDPIKEVIAAIHSGWRGSEKNILLKVLIKLKEEFHCDPLSMVVYIAPSISQKNYEIGEEVAFLFDEKYSVMKKSKYLLDLKQINRDILFHFGIRKENVQVSSLCSYEMKDLLHSYRRDGEISGRALGVIAMKVR